MTKKLEEEFNLPPIEEVLAQEKVEDVPTIEETKNAIGQLTIKVNETLKGVEGIHEVDSTIRDIAVLIGSIAYDKLD